MSETTTIARVPKGERKKQILELHDRGMRPCDIARELGIANAYASQTVRLARLRGETANRPSIGSSPPVEVFAYLVASYDCGNIQGAAVAQTRLRELGWDVRPLPRKDGNA